MRDGRFISYVKYVCQLLAFIIGPGIFGIVNFANAESALTLSSAEQGWALQFNSPTLMDIEESSSERRYRFFGKSAEGFFLSLHVEPLFAETISAQSCWSKYHAGGPHFPEIVDKQSVTIVLGDIPEVHYQARLQFRGKELSMPNTHYYFIMNGHCADLHMAATPVYDQKNEVPYVEVARRIKHSLVNGERVIGANGENLLSAKLGR